MVCRWQALLVVAAVGVGRAAVGAVGGGGKVGWGDVVVGVI